LSKHLGTKVTGVPEYLCGFFGMTRVVPESLMPASGAALFMDIWCKLLAVKIKGNDYDFDCTPEPN
jgi:hypothetical protein